MPRESRNAINNIFLPDLDGGWLSVPDCVHIPKLDDATYSELITQLCIVLRPQLVQADDAFPTSQTTPSPPVLLVSRRFRLHRGV